MIFCMYNPHSGHWEWACDLNLFTAEERTKLEKWGRWIKALCYELFEPTTPAQRHFLDVMAGRTRPNTDWENLWLKYLEHSWEWDCDRDRFSKDEQQKIAYFGHWMGALACRPLQPATSEQEHFVRAINGRCEPATELELLWLKYKTIRDEWYKEGERLAEIDGYEDDDDEGDGSQSNADPEEELIEAEYEEYMQEVDEGSPYDADDV